MSKKINSIVACCEGGGIGYKNTLPWRLKREMSHFRKVTLGSPPGGKKNAILMGRKTWESLPKALPKRYNFVLSRYGTEKSTGMDGIYSSLEDFVDDVNSEEWHDKIHEIFCIGGAQIYELLFNSSFCGLVYCTRVLAKYECDVYMPDMKDFQNLSEPGGVPLGIQEEADGTEWRVEVLTKT